MPIEKDSGDQPACLAPEEAARRVSLAVTAVAGEVQKSIVGKEDLVELLSIALFAQGHVLLSGRPGTAKTALLLALAKAFGLKARHFLMAEDTLPTDVCGYEADPHGENDSPGPRRIIRGPLFAALLIADGIDRAPRRTQLELFYGLRHGRVVIAGRTYELDSPRLVCALPAECDADNPLNQQQLDQFMFSYESQYPSECAEFDMVCRNSTTSKCEPRVVLRPRDLLWIQQLVGQMPVAGNVVNYAVDVVRATRPDEDGVPGFVRDWIDFGASPRAGEQIVAAAKARALIKGRTIVHCADVRAVARYALRHRVILSRNAQRRGISTEQVIDRIVSVVQERSASAAGPVNLVLVSDPGQTSVLGGRSPSSLPVTHAVQPVALPNRPYLAPQPPPTHAWPVPATTSDASSTLATDAPQANQWPPSAVPQRENEDNRRNAE